MTERRSNDVKQGQVVRPEITEMGMHEAAYHRGDPTVSAELCEARTQALSQAMTREVNGVNGRIEELSTQIGDLDKFLRNGISSTLNRHEGWLRALMLGASIGAAVIGWLSVRVYEVKTVVEVIERTLNIPIP